MITAQQRMPPPPTTETLISVEDLKLLVHRLSGYKIQISDDDPLLTTIYINRAVLGAALNKTAELQESVNKQIARLPGAADAEMQRAAKKAVTSLSEEVASIANRVAGDAAAAQRNKSFAFAVAAAVAGAVVCVGLGFGAGLGWNKLEIARIRVLAQERVDQAEKDTSWMKTDEGKAAKNLADMDQAVWLNECERDGWKKERDGKLGLGETYCYPYRNEKKELYGWKIKD